MSAKVTDRKGRWRNLTIAFRVSPQENEQKSMNLFVSVESLNNNTSSTTC